MKKTFEENESVNITKSSDLSAAGLGALAGRQGIVTEVKMDVEARNGAKKDNRGYWVKLAGEPFQGESEWFIPWLSVNPIPVKKKPQDLTGAVKEPKIKTVYDAEAGVSRTITDEG